MGRQIGDISAPKHTKSKPVSKSTCRTLLLNYATGKVSFTVLQFRGIVNRLITKRDGTISPISEQAVAPIQRALDLNQVPSREVVLEVFVAVSDAGFVKKSEETFFQRNGKWFYWDGPKCYGPFSTEQAARTAKSQFRVFKCPSSVP